MPWSLHSLSWIKPFPGGSKVLRSRYALSGERCQHGKDFFLFVPRRCHYPVRQKNEPGVPPQRRGGGWSISTRLTRLFESISAINFLKCTRTAATPRPSSLWVEGLGDWARSFRGWRLSGWQLSSCQAWCITPPHPRNQLNNNSYQLTNPLSKGHLSGCLDAVTVQI